MLLARTNEILAMKLVFLLSGAAPFIILGAAAGLACNALALPLFAVAASLLVLLIAIGDYQSRPRYARLRLARSGRSALPLAA